jgi:oxidoreductase
MRHVAAAAVIAVIASVVLLRRASPPAFPPRAHVERGGRTAVVLGPSGATGAHVLRHLLARDEWTKVVSIGRSAIATTHAKLEHQVVDYDALERSADKWQGADVVFNCLGTTRKRAGGAEEFIKVEATYAQVAARIAKQANVGQFSVITAGGANSNVWVPSTLLHPLLYMRTMGQKEDAATSQHFPRTSIFRPGLLARGVSDRFLETLAERFLPALKVSDLAMAMVLDAESDRPDSGASEPPHIYSNAMILDMVK